MIAISDAHVLNSVLLYITHDPSSSIYCILFTIATMSAADYEWASEIDIPEEDTVLEQVFISAELARHTLTLAAFPLFTGLYGYRGYKSGPLEPVKLESKAIEYLNTDIETLNEWYSPLVPVSWLVTKFTANSLGIVAFAWRSVINWYPEDFEDTKRFLDTTGFIGDAVSWCSGFIGFGALAVWIMRRQKRRQKDTSLSLIGAPEVSLVLHTIAFAAFVWIPCNDFMINGLEQFLRAERLGTS